MKFTLTSEHLDQAILKLKEPNNSHCENCPIALAVKESGYQDVQVRYSNTCIKGRDYPNNGLIKSTINLFDMGDYNQLRNVLPFTFELPILV